jgi:hypothetical protein
MKKFEFYTDEKCTIWLRTKFYVEAENEEEAQRMVKKACETAFIKCDVAEEFDGVSGREYLFDTTEGMVVSENEGFATIEVFDMHDNMIACNGKY